MECIIESHSYNHSSIGVSLFAGLDSPLEHGTGTWDWIIRLECGTGIWDWNITRARQQ